MEEGRETYRGIPGNATLAFDDRVIRLAGTLRAFARVFALIGGSVGFMNSSRRISPGCTGRMPFLIM
jgi:hypothetical protein